MKKTIISRRNFLGKAVTAGVSSIIVPSIGTFSKHTGTDLVPTIYYVDGYHGGVRGHMPLGCWRDILNRLRETPSWKVSLDVEPESFPYLRRRDPEAFYEVKQYLEDSSPKARMELVAGTYAQPFAWLFGGESLVRQFAFGLKVLRECFPKTDVETYSVQEPCFTSAMPQLLLSFGFKRAVLKNNTGFAGYMEGIDAEMVRWEGPDGSAIAAVPHYASEVLLAVWTTDSERATEDYAWRCVAKGINKPSGMAFQDLGWMAHPRVGGAHVHFTTWREYFDTIAQKPEKDYVASQEHIRGNLPWGSATMQVIGQQIRSAENRLLVAEKLASMASVLRGLPFPESRLDEAWEHTLDSQHHDAWVVAKSGRARKNWSWQVGAQTWIAEQICDEVIDNSREAMAAGTVTPLVTPIGTRNVRVFNTSPDNRVAVVELPITAENGTLGFRVVDDQGSEIASQFIVTRKQLPKDTVDAMTRKGILNPLTEGIKPSQQWRTGGDPATSPVMELLSGESLNAGHLLFPALLPSLGFRTYRIEEAGDVAPAPSGAKAEVAPDGIVDIETDLYRIRLDAQRGGIFTSLFDKKLQTDLVDSSAERGFQEFRGYFIKEKAWLSSMDSPVNVQILENGPIRVRLILSGRVGSYPFRTMMTFAQSQRPIDFHIRFEFPKDTRIGDPYLAPAGQGGSERRRSYHDDRWKLQAHFPVAFRHRAIYKDAAFDVCLSQLTDTFYQRWDEVKHNIILNWIDVFDEERKIGLGVFTDRVTTYAHGPDYPPALVLAWGSDAPPFWGDSPLEGEHEAGYALVPHAGRWDEAGLWLASRHWSEPPIPQLMTGKPDVRDRAESLVTVSGKGFDVPTMMVKGKDLFVRLFNAEGGEAQCIVSLPVKPTNVELVELDGRKIHDLSVERDADGRFQVAVVMPRFGLRTIRFSGVVRA